MSSKGADARELEKSMKGVASVKGKAMLDEMASDSNKGSKRSPKARKLRGIRFERAEGGFTGHPDFEPNRSTKSEIYDSPGGKPYVFAKLDDVHSFLRKHWGED